MKRAPLSTGLIYPNLRLFFAIGALLTCSAGACSAGESGLVLGPQLQFQGGSAGVAGATASAGADAGGGETLVLGG